MKIIVFAALLTLLPQAPEVEVLDVGWRVAETDRHGTKLAWKALVRNNTWRPVDFTLIVELKDWDGFVLVDDKESGLWLDDAETKEFAGMVRMHAGKAAPIHRAEARVLMR